MIERLQQPIPESELEFGWDEEGRIRWLGFFEKMHDQLVEDTLWDNPKLELYFDLVRLMDYFGIFGGKILNEAAIIAQEMQKATSKKWWPF